MYDKQECWLRAMLKHLTDEQEALWHELELEIKQAANGYWSMGVANRVARIVKNCQLGGLILVKDIPTELINQKIYSAIVTKFDVGPEFDLFITPEYPTAYAIMTSDWSEYELE